MATAMIDIVRKSILDMALHGQEWDKAHTAELFSGLSQSHLIDLNVDEARALLVGYRLANLDYMNKSILEELGRPNSRKIIGVVDEAEERGWRGLVREGLADELPKPGCPARFWLNQAGIDYVAMMLYHDDKPVIPDTEVAIKES